MSIFVWFRPNPPAVYCSFSSFKTQDVVCCLTWCNWEVSNSSHIIGRISAVTMAVYGGYNEIFPSTGKENFDGCYGKQCKRQDKNGNLKNQQVKWRWSRIFTLGLLNSKSWLSRDSPKKKLLWEIIKQKWYVGIHRKQLLRATAVVIAPHSYTLP